MHDDTARMRTIVTPPPPAAAVPEPTPVKSHKSFIVVLHRHDKTPYGFSVKGGADKPELPHVYVSLAQKIISLMSLLPHYHRSKRFNQRV